MAYIDKIAAIAAMRHARKPVVTASSDSVDFLEPIKVGQAIHLEAFVTYAHTTSMEVFVKIHSEDLLTGELRLTATAYLTFVAVGETGERVTVPAVYPETEEERFHYTSAPLRRQHRVDRRKNSGE